MRHRLTYLLSLSTALIGCGDDGVKHLADAPPSQKDAAVDATPDAPPGPVTITVVSAGAPQADVKVYFQGPDSTEILSTTTNAQGSASAMMPNGGFVTALDPFPVPVNTAIAGDHSLKTYANVKPGDHLVLNDTTIQPPFAQLIVALPLDAAAPTTYDVYTDCGLVHQNSFGWGELEVGNGSGSGTALAKVNPIHVRNLVAPVSPGQATIGTLGCNTAGTANFVVITKDVDGTPLNVAVAAAVSLDSDLIDLTAATFAPVNAYTFSFTNGATHLDGVDVALNFLGAGGEYATSYSDTTFGSADITAGAGTTISPVGIPTIPGTMPVAHLFLQTDQSSFGEPDSYQWGLAPTGTTIPMDLTNHLLLDYASEPAFDQATHAVSWTTNAGAAPNAYFLETEFDRGDGAADWEWDIVGAFSTASLAYPVLPGDGADYNALVDDSAFVRTVIVAQIPIGYDAVRPHAYDVIRVGADLTPLAAGTSGHFETDTYFPVDKLARAKTPNQIIRMMARATTPAALMMQPLHTRRARR